MLLYNVKGEAGDADEYQSLERAEVVREGTDISIFTYSRMRYVVMQAVQELEKKGFNPEVSGGGELEAVGCGWGKDGSRGLHGVGGEEGEPVVWLHG